MGQRYTDSFNQNLYIGYQCEWLADPTSTKGWKTVKLSGGILPLIFDGKVTIRTPYLTPELLNSKGWKLVGTGKTEKFGPDVDIYEKHYDDHIEAEKEGGWMADGFRYSWYLSITTWGQMSSYEGAEVKIAEKKSGGFCGNMENRVIFVGRIRNVNELETASELLGIKDYSDVIREEQKTIPYLMPEDLQPKAESLVDKLRPYSDKFNASEVTTVDKFEIKDRGSVWVINTKDNGFPQTLGGCRTIKGWLVREKDTDDVFEIVGVELPAVANKEDMLMEHIGILVKYKSTLKCQ